MLRLPHLHFLVLSKTQRLVLIIILSSLFFALEVTIGFRQHSLALVADAFHVASDLISFGVALYAVRKVNETERGLGDVKGKGFSFGFQRAELVSRIIRSCGENTESLQLGAFFNGVFLSALGVSIMLQVGCNTQFMEKLG